jgi:DNA-binding response OmpR family regulator
MMIPVSGGLCGAKLPSRGMNLTRRVTGQKRFGIKDKDLSCRIIMLSGRLGFSVATEALKLGADEYITKPFSVEFLLLTIKKVLGKAGRTAP